MATRTFTENDSFPANWRIVVTEGCIQLVFGEKKNKKERKHTVTPLYTLANEWRSLMRAFVSVLEIFLVFRNETKISPLK